jgi:pimeloyl-ACP methyl ester carboxylesterase
VPNYTTASGVALHVQDVGAGAGHPVVLLAGFGLNHRVWDGQVRALGSRRRTICVDLKGTGLSDKPFSGYAVDTLASEVLEVLTAMDVPNFDLVGWSFGGQIAFRMVTLAASKVDRLVLVGSNAVRASRSVDFPFGRDADRLTRALVKGEEQERAKSRRATLAAGFAHVPDDAVLDHLASLYMEMPSWAATACFESMYAADQLAHIPDVRCPVLQITGELDQVHPVAGARWLADRLARGKLITLDDCGHYPMFESPSAFNEVLCAFLDADPM